MSYVEHCKKHGQYKGDYCGDCIENTEKELELTKDMLDSADKHNQELTAENGRLREALLNCRVEGDDPERVKFLVDKALEGRLTRNDLLFSEQTSAKKCENCGKRSVDSDLYNYCVKCYDKMSDFSE